MEKFESKLSKTKAGERTRIWIEGKRLVAAGFTVGRFFRKQWKDNGTLHLAIVTAAQFDELPRAERGTVSGKGEKPIIDVTGAKVADHFKGERVSVRFSPDKIVISPPDA